MKCYNCGHEESEVDMTEVENAHFLCERCAESYFRYLDENAADLLNQERYEAFLGEF